MSGSRGTVRLPEHDAATAALLLAVDPHGLGGIVLKGMPGPTRDAWIESLQSLLPESSPYIRVPVNVGHDRLLGGLDFGATMASGKPVFARGLLECADGGIVAVSMAERLQSSAAAIIAGVLDRGAISVERDGMTRRSAGRFALVACDEGIDDEALDVGLADRLAFTTYLSDVTVLPWAPRSIDAARQRLAATEVPDEALVLLSHSAAAFAISSVRAVLFAVRAARAAAALCGKSVAGEAEVSLGARLVFPRRALAMPGQEEDTETPEPPTESDDEPAEQQAQKNMPDDVLVDAIRARVPAGLLAMLERQQILRRAKSAGGRGGPKTRSRRRGRPVGTHQGELGNGNRLNVLATLKAAAPWQVIRRDRASERPLHLRKEDIHVSRFEDRVEKTTIFAVDASGSQAAQRLAEVKGAIELILNDCYVRRDHVALIAFRGKSAESLLPPTRALARVKRSLRALPGGGGTPLAAGLDAARELALAESRQGRSATIVLLTDGRANITREGEAQAPQAETDALDSGRLIRAEGINSLLVDTSRRPRPRAKALADAMHAIYVPLPYADAKTISDTVQQSNV